MARSVQDGTTFLHKKTISEGSQWPTAIAVDDGWAVGHEWWARVLCGARTAPAALAAQALQPGGLVIARGASAIRPQSHPDVPLASGREIASP